MFKGVLFDFDGTIVRSMEDHFAGWQHAMKKFQVQLEPEELYMLEGQGVEKVALQLLESYHLPVSCSADVIQSKKEYWEKNHRTMLYPGIEESFQWLQARDVPIGVVTGGDRQRVIRTLMEFKIDQYFKGIVTSEDVTHTKPHPEPFLTGAKFLGIDPADCVVVENAPMGIKAAKSAGCFCIAICTTLAGTKLNEADIIISDFEELLTTLNRLF